MQVEAAYRKSKYGKINRAFTKRKTSKEETVNIADYSNINYSSRSESNISSPKTGKASITYDSDYSDDEKISSSSISREDKN